MSIAESGRKQAPLIESVLLAFAGWYRKQREIRQSLNIFDGIDDRQVKQMANDLHLSPADLRGMVRRGPDAAKLLYERMSVLHLDADRLESKDPAVMRDLQRLCSTCTTKKRCLKELAQDPGSAAWREHCPNENTLVALVGDDRIKH